MITIEGLKDFGADVNTGLSRCLNKEDFYLKMVNMGLADKRFEELEGVLKEKNLDSAFEMCHALKGVIGNLSLTPMYDKICEMTELLRARQDVDYLPMYEEIKASREKLLAL
ncbi:MAG: Hpt domain-containing protein [Treponema sp.]|nr:Hpt domain-containing protein [Treponema sp.]